MTAATVLATGAATALSPAITGTRPGVSLAAAALAAAACAPAAAWLPAQQRRGLPVTGRLLLAGVVAGVLVAAGIAGWVGIPAAVACAALLFLAQVCARTDLQVARIPKETCWQAAVTGGLLLAVALIAGQPVWTVDRAVVAAVCGLLLATAAVSWLRGRGGLGDVRLLAGTTALTWWWVDLNAVLAGVVVAWLIAAAVAATIAVRRPAGVGPSDGPLLRTMVPAGPVYVSVFVTAAAVTVAAAAGRWGT